MTHLRKKVEKSLSTLENGSKNLTTHLSFLTHELFERIKYHIRDYTSPNHRKWGLGISEFFPSFVTKFTVSLIQVLLNFRRFTALPFYSWFVTS